jgi:hypothetical protein
MRKDVSQPLDFVGVGFRDLLLVFSMSLTTTGIISRHLKILNIAVIYA